VGAKKGRNKRAAKGARKGGSAKQSGSKGVGRGTQRLGLVLFGVVFIALFVIFAVAQGIGAPSVPSDDAAIVKSVPDGNVSIAELKRSTGQQIAAKLASGELKKAPKPGTKKYEEVQTTALGELVEYLWISGEAEELGVTVTGKEVAASLKEIKEQQFKTEAAFQKFLKESHYTAADVNKIVRLRVVAQNLQEKVQNEAGPASAAEIQAYYDENKAAQYTTKPTRDVRVIVNKDKTKVEAALKALEADNSAANWKKVAGKYSSDPTTAKTGGLQKGISEEFLKGAVKKAIFESATGEVVGPTDFEKNFLVTEVVALHPAKVQTLAEVKSTISTQLTQTKQQEFFTEFINEFHTKWEGRTYCAEAFLNERCANYKGSGHPATAEPACYEANPKKPAKECPAPVTMTTPAVPGSVTLLKPKGEQKVQRPLPEHPEAAAATTELSPESAASPEAASSEQAAAEQAAAEAQAKIEAEAAAKAESGSKGKSGE
jgi:parvulin-like peptidyl-prolyl isomerase